MNAAEPRLALDGWSSNRRASAIRFAIGGAAALLLAAVFLLAQRLAA
jgi:hypothetical protein